METPYIQPEDYKNNVLLYGSECWRMIENDNRRLATLHITCLRRIMRVFWPNKISNARQKGMGIILQRRRWRWLGHVLRMEPTARARTALTWTQSEGRKEKGRPGATWRRTVMEEMRERWYWLGEIHKTIAQDRAISRDLDEAMCHRALWN